MRIERSTTINLLMVLVVSLTLGVVIAYAQCSASNGNGYGSYCSDGGGCPAFGGGGYTWGAYCSVTWCNSHNLSCPAFLYNETNCCIIGCYNYFCAGCFSC